VTAVSSLMDRLLDLSKNSLQYENSMCPSMIRNDVFFLRNHFEQSNIIGVQWPFLSATPFCFGELYILQGSEVSMSNFVLLFDTWFLLHSLILLMQKDIL
jgi:hypothetical protein